MWGQNRECGQLAVDIHSGAYVVTVTGYRPQGTERAIFSPAERGGREHSISSDTREKENGARPVRARAVRLVVDRPKFGRQGAPRLRLKCRPSPVMRAAVDSLVIRRRGRASGFRAIRKCR